MMYSLICRRERRLGRAEEGGQGSLALQQGLRPQVVAVEMQEIEGVEDQLFGPAALQRLLQSRNAGHAGRILHGDLAVEDRLSAAQALEGTGQVPVVACPVEAVAGDQPHAFLLDIGHRAIAIELDLMQPVVAHRRRSPQGGELRADDGGQRCQAGRRWASVGVKRRGGTSACP